MHIWYHNHHSTKPATFKCINSTSHFPLLSSQCIYFSSGTWLTLEVALWLKKGSNQLFKMSTLIWFLFPSSQLLRLSQETPMPPFHTLPQLQPQCQPQPQNLGVSCRDEAAQLYIQDTQARPKSFSSKTCLVSQGREVLTGDAGVDGPQRTSAPLTRSAQRRHASPRWLVPHQQSRENTWCLGARPGKEMSYIPINFKRL